MPDRQTERRERDRRRKLGGGWKGVKENGIEKNEKRDRDRWINGMVEKNTRRERE